MPTKKYSLVISTFAVAAVACSALATPIGRPVSLDITISQGGTDIISAQNISIPAADLLDGKNYIDLGSIGGGLSNVYLSVELQDETAQEGWVSFYLRSTSPGNAMVPGVIPLFDLNGSGMIDVSITNLEFEHGGVDSNVVLTQFASPLGDNSASMYMMNSAGWYYDLPEADPLWIGPKLTQQVPYSDFRDGNPAVYDFDDDTGTSLDVAWNNMHSPVDTAYTIIQSDSPYASTTDTSGGAVFEMGLNAFAYDVNIPEPATVGLLLLGGVTCLRRRWC